MDKTDKQFIIRLPSHFHKRLKVVASMCDMTMQEITVNAIKRELDVFDNTVPMLKDIPGVAEYKKMHSNITKDVKITETLDVMNEKLEETILTQEMENSDMVGNIVNKIIKPDNTEDIN